MVRNLQELYRYRALLWALTVRELRARYRASVLGFLWTFLNPALNMAVYVVFYRVVLSLSAAGAPDKRYAYSLLCGLLPWIFFSSSVIGGTSSVSERRDLLTKVRFPAQVLPATVVLTNLVNFLLSLPLLFGLGLFFEDLPSWHIVFLVPVLAVQTLFTLALTYFFSALNVTFRDLQHIVANLMQMAFFLTPVLWPLEQLKNADLRQIALYANPMVSLITSWRQIFFDHQVPDMAPLGVVALVSVALMWVSAQVFERRREEFAELV